MADTTHEAFAQPEKNTPLWRYMDLAKLLDLLTTESLFFPNVTSFDDAFEATSPKPLVEEIDKLISDDEYRKTRAEEIDEDVLQKTIEQFQNLKRELRKSMFVSCWHANANESAYMWKIYTQIGDSIAIQLPYENLCASLPDEVLIGLVHYIDYEGETFRDRSLFTNLINWVSHKRLAYAHENEVRAVLFDFQGRHEFSSDKIKRVDDGYRVKGDLSNLDATIVVNPDASSWLAEAVNGLIAMTGLKWPVTQSALLQEPYD
mgnify:CR=1 FL=1|tara:strand:- start:177 stop:959 length:783 start_codon:yes stop_codon:yes gene_type:complete